jgi:predicted transcriptional regulator
MKSAPTASPATYPRPGTHADRVLSHIKSNPGTTKNGIIEALKLNPSVVRDIMRILLNKNLVTDQPDSEQRHHYTAKAPKL